MLRRDGPVNLTTVANSTSDAQTLSDIEMLLFLGAGLEGADIVVDIIDTSGFHTQNLTAVDYTANVVDRAAKSIFFVKQNAFSLMRGSHSAGCNRPSTVLLATTATGKSTTSAIWILLTAAVFDIKCELYHQGSS